jgi:hypothetical protein
VPLRPLATDYSLLATYYSCFWEGRTPGPIRMRAAAFLVRGSEDIWSRFVKAVHHLPYKSTIRFQRCISHLQPSSIGPNAGSFESHEYVLLFSFVMTMQKDLIGSKTRTSRDVVITSAERHQVVDIKPSSNILPSTLPEVVMDYTNKI